MDVWISGRIDSEVGAFFVDVRNATQNDLKDKLSKTNYGPQIESLDVIMIIYRNGGEEVFKYNARDKSTDLEVRVDHTEFKEGDLNSRKLLFFRAIIHGLTKLRSHKKLKDFSFDKLIDDINSVMMQTKRLI